MGFQVDPSLRRLLDSDTKITPYARENEERYRKFLDTLEISCEGVLDILLQACSRNDLFRAEFLDFLKEECDSVTYEGMVESTIFNKRK